MHLFQVNFLNSQARRYRSLNEWFKTPQGARIASAFCLELHKIQEDLSGRFLLQLGGCGDNLWLSELHYRYRWVLDPYRYPPYSSAISSLVELPFEKNSVDCVVAPMAFEALSHEKNPLVEIDRILKPMGFVILLGINPWSFWGLALKAERIACLGHEPVTLTSSLSIKRQLLHRGYVQCLHSSFYYVPPVKRALVLNHLQFLNQVGSMLWPFPAGFYCLVMQKYAPCYGGYRFAVAQDEKILGAMPRICS